MNMETDEDGVVTYELEGVDNIQFKCDHVEVTVLCDPFDTGELTPVKCKFDEKVFMDMSREMWFPF